MNVVLTADLQQKIFRHLEAAYPNEGGGFLLGSLGTDSVRIVDIVPVENIFERAEQYHRYAMTPLDWARLEDQADERGLTLVGYFHSHPDSPAIPSIYDRDHALPNFTYIITQVQDAQAVDMRVWRLRSDRTQFDANVLVIEHNEEGENIVADALVNTQWVADNKNNVRLIEVDVDTTQYESGHIPGAVAFNWQTQLQNQTLRDIATQEEFEGLLSDAGVTPQTQVVLYGDNNNWFAAYAFWLFKYYGHENVSLLNGGRKKWLAEGRETTTDVSNYPRTAYKVTSIHSDLRADRDYVKARLNDPKTGLVDVRSVDEYTGKIIAPPNMPETAQRAGHIPGASNIPWAQAVAEDGTYKSREDLEKLYGGKGITSDKEEIIAYCRIGERSSHSWFALKYILGYDKVRNYDGSWTEWGNLVGAPIRKGEQA